MICFVVRGNPVDRRAKVWLFVVLLAGCALARDPQLANAPYVDSKLSVEERCGDLLSRMTVAEKLAQLGKMRAFLAYERIGDTIAVAPDVRTAIRTNCAGQVYGVLRADWWTKRDWQTGVTPEMSSAALREFQRIAVEETRLGIPFLFVEEAPHGLMALGEPVFPTGLGLGSSFDRDLVYRVGRAIGAARTRGVHSVYAPILDLARDPRWSRVEECFGEDPELVSVLGEAEFRGLRDAGMTPCLKHYVGGGNAEGGHNTASVHLGPNEFFNVQLRPFRRCVAVGARALMSTYHDVDGEQCTFSRYLLTDILRGQLGFDGFVTADAGAAQMPYGRRIARSVDESCAMCLRAGCDTECGSSPGRAGATLIGGLREGLLSEADLDIAVRRLLKVKFEMGLFERPYGDALSRDVLEKAQKESAALALEAARKSLVLLTNNGVLPLGRSVNCAVVGPNADDRIMNQLGDYTAPQRRTDVSTVLDGVRRFVADVAYAKGCGIRSKSRDGFAAAERCATDAEVTVLVLGGSSSPYGSVTLSDEMAGATVVTGAESDDNDKDSGEGTDRCSLGYSGVQMELFRAVRAKARKLIVVLVQGRPLVVDELVEKADAVLLAWYPGSAGGRAIGEVLFGEVNPSGRLPIAIPHGVGQLPVFSDGTDVRRKLYIDGPGDAAYPFGYGLSYTKFVYEGVRVEKNAVSVEVRNIGAREGDEIVRVYFTVTGSGRQRPCRELLAFARVSLNAGEMKCVTLPFDGKIFGFYGRDGRYESPRGDVTVFVDGCADRQTLSFSN